MSAKRLSVIALACAGSVLAGCGGSEKATAPTATAPVALGVGQALLVDSGQTTAQLTLTTGGQYMIAVVNTTPSTASIESFTLAGEGPSGTVAPSAHAPAEPVPSVSTQAVRFRPHAPIGRGPQPLDAHLIMLEHDRALVHQLIARRGNPITSARDQARRASLRAAAAVAPAAKGVTLGARSIGAPGVISSTVGDSSRVYIRQSLTGSCADVDTVTARTVYVSQKLRILEDIASPYAGQLDSFYVDTLAPEYDATTYGEVATNFGDPLLIDDSLSSAGRVTVLFSPVLNTILQGVAGFVNPCDFFPTNSAPASSDTAVRSNQTEIFYAFVPDSGWPPQYWTLFIRSVAAHETKHVASFAQHLYDNAPNFEELWLEEATAQASAEIWMRHYTPSQWKGNNDFAVSLGCELITGSCGAVDPLDLSQSHFVWLYNFLTSLESESIIGGTTEAKYGGAWSFARWAADQYASSEPAFFKAIIDDPVNTGLPNVAAHTGASIGTMLVDFYLATASNDYASNFAAQRVLTTLPSWNQRDIYAELHADIPSYFAVPYPLVPRTASSGSLDVSVSGIQGGGASVILLTATASGTQTLTLESGTGGALAAGAGLRLGVIRVE
jgi:hypothetical protein